MGHGNNTTGAEGKAGVGTDEEGPGRLARFASGFAGGVGAVNQQQPSATGSGVNAATQLATTMLNRAQADEDQPGKLPAWYIIQKQREAQQKLREAPRTPPIVPAL